MHRHAIDVPQGVTRGQQPRQVLLEALLRGPEVGGLRRKVVRWT